VCSSDLPKLYQGKQRIAATLGAAAALKIARALLACAIEDAKQWPGPVVLSPAHREDVGWAQLLLPEAEVVAQPEGNLGQRIITVDNILRQRGHQRILITGTDAPLLSPNFFQIAAAQLDHDDITLSTASDGGVTLMASRCGWPDLSALPWSTEQLNEALFKCCQNAGLKTGYIAPSYDIDRQQDLIKLIKDLKYDPRPARQNLLACVETILEKDKSHA
jgi:glycosyltransferase A (GT-A) superfamily protein (DUF2064 family)